MSEAAAAQAATMAGVEASSLSPSAGTLIRQAREAAGLHIGALSVALKVPVKKLEALEADQHAQLPDAVFARALAASVCRTLKIDPEPVLSRLPMHVMPRLELDSSTSDRANLYPPRALWHAPLLSRVPRPVLVMAALLVVGALALYVLPSLTPVPLLPASGSAAPGVEEAGTAPAGTPNAAAPVAFTPPAPVEASTPAALAAMAPTATPTPLPAPVAAPASALAVVPSVALPSAVEPGGTSVLLFKAKGASWVEVTDAAGVQQLRRILNAGEVVPVVGALPLAVVVGRADAVDVLVRGQTFDLAGLARDNVARFQIK